jgi:hypothetical protein
MILRRRVAGGVRFAQGSARKTKDRAEFSEDSAPFARAASQRLVNHDACRRFE